MQLELNHLNLVLCVNTNSKSRGGRWHTNNWLSRDEASWLLTTHLMGTQNHFQLLQEPICQFVPSQRGQELLNCLMGLSSNVPGPTEQHSNKGTVKLSGNREIDGFSKGGSSANQLDTNHKEFNALCEVPSPPSPLPMLTFKHRSGAARELYVLNFTFRQPLCVIQEQALCQLQYCTHCCGKRQIFKIAWDFLRKEIF